MKIQLGFPGLLAVVFITLKLLNIITWSWVWVLAPLWFGLALVGILLLVMIVLMALGVSLK